MRAWLVTSLARLVGVFTRRSADNQLREEIEAHLDLLAEEFRQRGFAPVDAQAAARRAFGARVLMEERYRDQRGIPLFETLAQDLRRAWVSVLRSPATTVTIVLTLALGIGATTAIFSIVDGVLLRPAPVANMDRLVMLWETDRNSSTVREPASVPDYLDYRDRVERVRPIGALFGTSVTLSASGAEPQQLPALRISSSALTMLGVRLRMGRVLSEDDDRPGAPVNILISETLWARQFASDANVIGRSVALGDVPATIAGVVTTASDFGVLQVLNAADYGRAFAARGEATRVDVWLPLQPDPRAERSNHPLFMLGQLAADADVADAQHELSAVASELERTYPENAQRGIHVEPLEEVVFGPVRPALLLLMGAVALVLVVACVNVINLLLVRSLARRHEVAVQAALGASAGRVARQSLVEAMLLTAAGGLAGIVVAGALLRHLVALAPQGLPRLTEVAIDPRVLSVTLAICGVVGVLMGLVPTQQVRATDLQGALRSGNGPRSSADRERGRARAGLVVAELALAVMLLVGASLLLRSFSALQAVNPGYEASRVLKLEFQLPRARYPADFRLFPNFKEMHAFNAATLERVTALPGVEGAALAGNHPVDPGYTNSFVIVGREAEAETAPEISVRRVSTGYFKTVGLPVVRGRAIEDSDMTSSAPVALLNEAAVRRFFPTQDPLGATIRFWGFSRRVVGIVADERTHGLAVPAPIAVYVPLAQAPSAQADGVILVRSGQDHRPLAAAVRNVVRELDPGVAVHGIESLDRTLLRSVANRRFATFLLAMFALAALGLAALGVHGVFRYNVAQRTREVGIRLALGAQPRQAMWLMMREGAQLAAVGIGLGATGAWTLSRLLRSLLFEVSPTDPIAFGGVIVVMAGVAGAATLFATRGVLRVTPTHALQSE